MGDGAKISFLLSVFIFVSVFGGILEANEGGFQGLGDLTGDEFWSRAYAVSSNGSVAVGYSKSSSGYEAFRWTDSNGMVGLGDFPGITFESKSQDVSSDGSVVVGRGASDSGYEAFRWTDSNGMVSLGDLPGGIYDNIAYGVSADGSVVVGESDSNSGTEAFRWTDSNGMVGLGDLSGGTFYSSARSVSSDGSVTVGRGSSSSGTEAFRWTDANGMVGLGDLSGGDFYSIAYGVSADGSVVVGYSKSSSGNEAFRWTDSNGMVGLGDLSGGNFYSIAYDVSADGSVIVGTSATAGGNEAFIWDANNGMRNIKDVMENTYGFDLTGWTLTQARGVSADGMTIVGNGTNPSGYNEAWMAMIPKVYHVDGVSGNDSNDGLTRETAFATIQKGIDTAKNGYTVIVWPDLYLTPNPDPPEKIDFNGKNIVLRSADPNDPNVVDSTVIRGVVEFDGTEDVNCVFTGFTVRDLYNGAIWGNDTNATISHCVFSGNGPCQGIVVMDCHGTIINCLIADNINYGGCGTPQWAVYGCHGLIKNCTITNNSPGGGILIWNGGTTNIENCIIYNNAGNEISVASGSELNISYSDVEGGQSGIGGSGTVNWGVGNIENDPCFAEIGYWQTNPSYQLFEGDYHLKSEGWRLNEYSASGYTWTWDFVTSRCIDAANPGANLASELLTIPRDPNNDYGENLRINMGAYGRTDQASMPPYDWALLADLNNDGTVDFGDFAKQANDWLVNAIELPADLDRDGTVNMPDIGKLTDDWLKTTDWQ